MVVILLSFLLKRVPFYIRNWLILLMVIFYAFLCWGDASVVRATIMACLTLFVLFWGREISIRRSLKYACFILLCISPFSLLYDVWFLLSFSAIIGIVLFQNMVQYFWTKHKQNTIYQTTQQKEFWIVIHLKKLLKDFWNNYVVPTIWASLWTAPILLFFMNWVNITGIFLNLFIVPFIPILTIYWFWSLLLFTIFPWNLWTNIEIFLMDILFSLSDFWSHYAIFFQSKNLLTKYLFSLWFLILWITFYRFFWNIKPIDLIKQKNNDTKVHNTKSSFSEDEFFENL